MHAKVFLVQALNAWLEFPGSSISGHNVRFGHRERIWSKLLQTDRHGGACRMLRDQLLNWLQCILHQATSKKALSFSPLLLQDAASA